MTEKQKRFVDEYLIDCNATRAYKAAYPNIKNDSVAASNANRLLRNAEIKSYVDEQLEKLHNEKTADAAEVMEYLTSVMRGTSEAEIVVIEGEGDGISTARKMMKAPDEREKLKAAELLGKRFGLFTDKVDLNSAAAVQIVDDIPRTTGGGTDAKA